MRVEFDRRANAAYIYLREIEAGGVDKTVAVDEEPIYLDFDRHGKLIGIEVLKATKHLPEEVLRKAERL